jgi:hypothetical protein
VVDLLAQHVTNLRDSDGGRYVCRCPFHDERTPSFTIWPDHFHCYGCGAHGDVIEAAMRLGKLSFQAAVDRLRRDTGVDHVLTAEERQELERRRQQRERKAAEAAAAKLRASKRIIRETGPSPGSGVATYFAARHLPFPTQARDLLFHRALEQWEPDSRNPTKMVAVARWPAMVAIVRDKTGAVVGIHRTYFDRDCKRKAPIDRPKRMLGDCAGGAVRLGPPAPKIGTCEGIETGIAFQSEYGVSTWCGLNTSGLAALELPDLPMGSEPIIGADKDQNGAGESAARKAMARWLAEGRQPRLVMPNDVDTDFADVVAAKRRLGVAA